MRVRCHSGTLEAAYIIFVPMTNRGAGMTNERLLDRSNLIVMTNSVTAGV